MYILPFNPWNLASPTLPKMYWAVKSQEQLIAQLYCVIEYLTEYENEQTNAINANTEEIKNVPAQIAEMNEYLNKSIDALYGLIRDITAGNNVWDVSKGEFGGAVDAMRANSMFACPFTYTIEEFNGLALTVSSLATQKLNCWGVAVISCAIDNDMPYIPKHLLNH